MKSMKQMQDEILSKARWDGGWPRAVIVGFGCVALARDQEHYDELVKSNMCAWKWAAITVVLLSVILLLACLAVWIAP